MKKNRLYINLISNVVSFMIQLAISFIITPIIVEKVGDAAYGFVGLANNFVNYASILTIVINSMASRFVTMELEKKNLESANKYYSTVFFINIILSSIIFILSILLILNITIVLDVPTELVKDVKVTFALAFVNMIISLFTSVFNISTFAKNRLDLSAIRTIIGNIIRVILLIILFSMFKAKIYFIILSSLVMGIYLLISNYNLTKKIAPELSLEKNKFDTNSLKKLAKSGVWNSINTLSKTLLTGLDLLITNIFVGASPMGILSIAKTVPNSIENLLAVFANTFNPEFVILYSKNKIKELIDEVNFSTKMVAFIMIVPLAGYAVFGTEFFSLWLHEKSTEEIYKIQILSILSVAPFFASVCNYTLFLLDSVTNKLKRPVVATSIMSILSTLTTLILLYTTDLGVYAVAGVSSVYWIIKVSTFNVINAAKNLNQKWYLFYKAYLKNILAFIVILIVFIMIKQFIVINSWLLLALYGGIFAVIGYCISFIIILNKKERKKMLNKLKKIMKIKK